MNYTGNRLQGFSADPSPRTCHTVSQPVDLNLAYQLTRHVSVDANAINRVNAPTTHAYLFIADRKSRSDLHTTIIKYGVSGSF